MFAQPLRAPARPLRAPVPVPRLFRSLKGRSGCAARILPARGRRCARRARTPLGPGVPRPARQRGRSQRGTGTAEPAPPPCHSSRSALPRWQLCRAFQRALAPLPSASGVQLEAGLPLAGFPFHIAGLLHTDKLLSERFFAFKTKRDNLPHVHQKPQKPKHPTPTYTKNQPPLPPRHFPSPQATRLFIS